MKPSKTAHRKVCFGLVFQSVHHIRWQLLLVVLPLLLHALPVAAQDAVGATQGHGGGVEALAVGLGIGLSRTLAQ